MGNILIKCSKCNHIKDETAFSFRHKIKNIRHRQCKVCLQVNIHNHYTENKKEYKNRVKEWVKSNKEKRAANMRNSYAKIKGYAPCTCCDKSEIDNFLANCPEGCDVDHVKTIRQNGKHCLKNIRYLETSTHCRKSQWERYNA